MSRCTASWSLGRKSRITRSSSQPEGLPAALQVEHVAARQPVPELRPRTTAVEHPTTPDPGRRCSCPSHAAASTSLVGRQRVSPTSTSKSKVSPLRSTCSVQQPGTSRIHPVPHSSPGLTQFDESCRSGPQTGSTASPPRRARNVASPEPVTRHTNFASEPASIGQSPNVKTHPWISSEPPSSISPADVRLPSHPSTVDDESAAPPQPAATTTMATTMDLTVDIVTQPEPPRNPSLRREERRKPHSQPLNGSPDRPQTRVPKPRRSGIPNHRIGGAISWRRTGAVASSPVSPCNGLWRSRFCVDTRTAGASLCRLRAVDRCARGSVMSAGARR